MCGPNFIRNAIWVTGGAVLGLLARIVSPAKRQPTPQRSPSAGRPMHPTARQDRYEEPSSDALWHDFETTIPLGG